MRFIEVFSASSFFDPKLILFFIVSLFSLYLARRFILSFDYGESENPEHERRLQETFASFLKFPYSFLIAGVICFGIGIYSNAQPASKVEIEKAIACVNNPAMEYSRELLKDELNRTVIREFKVRYITRYCEYRYQEIQQFNQNKNYSKQIVSP